MFPKLKDAEWFENPSVFRRCLIQVRSSSSLRQRIMGIRFDCESTAALMAIIRWGKNDLLHGT